MGGRCDLHVGRPFPLVVHTWLMHHTYRHPRMVHTILHLRPFEALTYSAHNAENSPTCEKAKHAPSSSELKQFPSVCILMGREFRLWEATDVGYEVDVKPTV